MKYKKPKATLQHATPLSISEVGARVCYNSFGMSEHETIRNFENTLSLEDIPSSRVLDDLTWTYHHESINEHINLSYYVQDVSRETVIEWNRTRIGMATSQQSSRYTMEPVVNAWVDYNTGAIQWDEFVAMVGVYVIDDTKSAIEADAMYIATKLTIYNAEEPIIKDLKGSKKKKQNDRVKRCLPEVWMLKGLWTFNLRALKHFIKLRDSGSAYYGIREVAKTILEATPQKYLDLVIKPSK